MPGSFVCGICGRNHEGAPLSWGPDAPDAWISIPAGNRAENSELGSDQCILDGRFFVRGRIEIPVIGTEEIFAWLVWAEVSNTDFMNISRLWTTAGREKQASIYDGRIANELPIYPSPTLGVAVRLHTRPVGERPFFEVAGEHAVRDEQRNGISSHRVQEIADILTQ